MRVFWVATALAAIAYIILSLSRTTWISMVVGVGTLWWLAGHTVKWRTVLRVGVVAVIVSAGLVASGFAQVLVTRVAAAFSIADIGVYDPNIGRLAVWRAVWERFTEHPLVGGGIDSTELFVRRMTLGVAGNPHNIYVQTLAELGIVGFLLFLTVLPGAFLWVWRAARRLPIDLRPYAWAVAAGLAAYMAQGVFQYDFQDLGVWMLLGLAAALARVALMTDPTSATLDGALR